MHGRQVFAAALLLVACKRNSGDEGAVREDLQKADALRTQHIDALRAGLAAANNLTVGTAPCPQIKPRQEPKDAAERKLQGQLASMQAAAGGELGHTVVVPSDKLAELVPATAVRVARRSESVAAELGKSSLQRSRDFAALQKDAAELAAESYWTFDVIAVVDQRQAPSEVRPEKGTFKSGAVVGRSYLYDYQAKAIVCAGRFEATSGGSVDYASQNQPVPRNNAGYAAAVDLDAQTMKAAEEALRALPR
jgi:hypothetical protein